MKKTKTREINPNYLKKRKSDWTCFDCNQLNDNRMYVCEECYTISKSHLPLITKYIFKEQAEKYKSITTGIGYAVFFIFGLLFISIEHILIPVFGDSEIIGIICLLFVIACGFASKYISNRLFHKRVNKNLENHLRMYREFAKDIIVNIKNSPNPIKEVYYFGQKQRIEEKLNSIKK